MGDAEAAPLIELRDVVKVYGRGEAQVRALDTVDLVIEDGEFVAVMGPSGSGKSTMMNILGCLDVVSSGSFCFRGIAVEGLDRHQRALLRRHYLSFVFQGFNLLKRTPALENVELPLAYRGMPAAERSERAREALTLVGLADRVDHCSSELSGGQQQRVAIARAIVTEPSLLLADEPTGNLDTERSHDLMRLMSGLNKDKGITILMVTHEPEMTEYASRIIECRDGKIVRDERKG